MVRKRGFDSAYERMSNKMRRKSSTQGTPSSICSSEVKNSLSDGLLSLYKKEADKLKDSSSADSEIEFIDNSLNQELDDSQSFSMVTKPEKKKHKAASNSSVQQQAKNKDVPNPARVDFDQAETPSQSARKVKKTISKAVTIKYSSITFENCGGIDHMITVSVVHMITELFEMFMPLKIPQLYNYLKISPVRGLLLHGPPGCGKTHLARAIAGEFQIPLIEIAATELVCGISGESEGKIRDTFDLAINTGRCILFIDEIDAITPKRETANGGMEKRMVSQLIKCLDELNDKDASFNVMVIGATNMPDSIDASLRGGGRFDTELAIGIPNEQAKLQILEVLCKEVKLASDVNLAWIAHHAAGYVASDLKNLVTKALKIGTRRIKKQFMEPISSSANSSRSTLQTARSWFNALSVSEEELPNFHFELRDFKEALKVVVPNCKREGFASVPDVSWDDVGALEDVRKELQSSIMWPVKYGKFYEDQNLSSTKGILLHGPKGCGKTLIAKALANECNINFLCVNGPELLNMYFGESEKAVRRCFERARNSAPCVIFFDEFDAYCPSRSASNSNAAAERVVNQLLTEMDGMQERKQVFVIAATNRKEKIDSAMLRPGRLEKQIYVGLPSPNGRIDILKSLTKNKTRPKIADDLNLETIALDERCNGFSGADLAFLVREAAKKAVEEFISTLEVKKEHNDLSDVNFTVNWSHFDKVLDGKKIKPSIDEKERKYFERHQELESSD